MKRNFPFSFYWIVVFLFGFRQFAAAFPEPDCVYITTWSVTANPEIGAVFSLPEPGLTNESMTISGWAFVRDGTLLETEMSDSCPTRSTSLAWPQRVLVTSSEGSFSTNENGPFSVSFIPSQVGDGQMDIDVASFGTFHFTNGAAFASYFLPYSIFPKKRLSYLSFNNSTLEGDLGQLPATVVNITRVPSPFGSGINFDSGSSMELKYPAFQSDVFSLSEPDGSTAYSTGSPNIRLNEGTVRFWFSPNWSSGGGPTGGVLFQVCGSGSPVRTIQIASSGSAIQIDSLSFPVNLIAGHWYQIAATYSSNSTAIYTNGIQAGATGGGVIGSPVVVVGGLGSQFVAFDSFRVGSDGGSGQARGIMDEVETFNYVQSSADILTAYQASSTVDADGDGVPDVQEFQSGLDPSDPSGGNPAPIQPPAPDPGDTTPPIINLLEPINAVKQ